jgi:hypothetical protein
MALRLIDLRQAALYEYPEFGAVPWPRPWYQGLAGFAVMMAVQVACWAVFVLLVF